MHQKRYRLLPFTGKNVNFHNHASQKLAPLLAFHQKEADEFGGDDLSRTGEEGLGESREGGFKVSSRHGSLLTSTQI